MSELALTDQELEHIVDHVLERAGDELVRRFERTLDQRRTISEAEHRADHEFLRTWRERECRRAKMWARIREQVVGWSIVAALGVIGTAAWMLIKNWIHPPSGPSGPP